MTIMLRYKINVTPVKLYSFFHKNFGEKFFIGIFTQNRVTFFYTDNYDLIIQAREGQNMKEFHAHSLILSARSAYFNTALSFESSENGNGIIILSNQIFLFFRHLIIQFYCVILFSKLQNEKFYHNNSN